MALANLYNIPVTEQDFLVFSFSNADQHTQIISAIAAKKGVILPTYILDPIPPGDVVTWLELHQQAHVDFTTILGIQGFDLTDVDFKNPEQMASWARLHGQEHQVAAAMLGIS